MSDELEAVTEEEEALLKDEEKEEIEEEKEEKGEVEEEKEEIKPDPNELLEIVEDLKRQISSLNMKNAEDRIEKKQLEEQITALREKPSEEDLGEIVTKADLRKALETQRIQLKKEAINDRDKFDLEQARQDPAFTKIEAMAKEVLDTDPDMNAGYKFAKNLPAYYRKIAKLHPDYEEGIKTATRTDTVKQINKATTAVQTGAGLGSKGKVKTKSESYDDLTIEDMNKMTDAEIAALPESVQKRLLEGE